MINKWLITGDLHGNASRFAETYEDELNPSEVGIIILGDAGVNYFLDKRDLRLKETLKNYLFRFYLVRGNHEARPSDVPNMVELYDQEVKNFVYLEPNYPSIRYLQDGEVYNFNGISALVVGGAYSVDKEYRQKMGWSWFANEQLSSKEWVDIHNKTDGLKVDMVLTHTCPISWEPTDLFLDFIKQDTVDKSMENELETLKNSIDWGVWLFGHFHADRLERPRVEQMFKYIDNLETVRDRWLPGAEEPEWWMRKSPNYYKED